MRRSSFIVAAFLLSVPLFAHAHATPVSVTPEGQVNEVPKEITIRFSERVEEGASRINAAAPSGARVTEKTFVDPTDPHILRAALSSNESGVYVVTWSVVSLDDGHFTKGGFSFGVGVAAPLESSQTQVVQSAKKTEALFIFIELLGNSLLWGVLILFAFVIRPQSAAGGVSHHAVTFVRRLLLVLVCAGGALVLFGGGGHMFLKSAELASVSETSLRVGIETYAHTKAGAATIVRIAAGVLFFLLYVLFRKTILTAKRITIGEWLLLGALLLFAYFRAVISHATANPFFPELSVLVNVFHLIEKDLWAGMLIPVTILLSVRSLQSFVLQLIPRLFSILALQVALVGMTGTYIVWLHLKEFANITSTLWGETFVGLLGIAGALVVLRIYHELCRVHRPSFFSRWLSMTLPAEAFLAIALVFVSSVMIITSPPLPTTPLLKEKDQGIRMTLQASPYEDATMLLTLSDTAHAPLIRVGNAGDEEGSLIVSASERFPGGYAFPSALFSPDRNTLFVTLSREQGYDAHGVFTVRSADLRAKEGRTLDLFTLVCMGVGMAALIVGVALNRYGRREKVLEAGRGSALRVAGGVLLGAVTALFASYSMFFVAPNTFKRACIADGNAWHLMLPTKAGTPVSSVPREGCMALGGTYHIADAREYEAVRHPKPARAELLNTPKEFIAGKPFRLSFSVQEENGEPAKLFISHERLIHTIVISEDMREFFHVHPEGAPNASTFFTFPRGGSYLIAFDYSHGLTAEQKTFEVQVAGPSQSSIGRYSSPSKSGSYAVVLDKQLLFQNRPQTITFRITKEGKDVLDLEPYLGAAMHIALVKDDRSAFVHTHGEVHPDGAPATPPQPGNHNHALPPARFGPVIEAHLPELQKGTYTLFAEFKHQGEVIMAPFTITVE